MNQYEQDTTVDNIARTLLYEGYCLYPYRRNAVKNKLPVPFGVIFPPQYSANNQNAPNLMQTECLAMVDEVSVSLRFLHLMQQTVYKFDPYAHENNLRPVDLLSVNNKTYESGWIATERKVETGSFKIDELAKESIQIPFHFDAYEEIENIISQSDDPSGRVIKSQANIDGVLLLEASPLNEYNIWRLSVKIRNKTLDIKNIHDRNKAMEQSLLSTHTILKTHTGKFISIQDPPEKWKELSKDCINLHTWPVLVDEENTVMLSSPIIIYDHPQINPDSPGDLFDSGEIEEYLMLHINMIPENEKQRIAQNDKKMKEMLERAARVTPDEFLKLHGEMKESKFYPMKD